MVCMIPHIIGISGVTGAGKSTLVKILAQVLNATVVSWDEFDEISTEPLDYVEWYYRDRNYEEFRREALASVLKTLKTNKIVVHPVSEQTLVPTKYIIFDAPLGRCHQQTGQYIDTCIHITVPLDVSLCRRILRDFVDPVKTKEAMLEELSFYLKHSRPLFFDDDLRQTANLVVDGLLSPQEELEVVKHYLTGEQVMQKELDSYRSLVQKFTI